MSTESATNLSNTVNIGEQHQNTLDLNGLEHVFRWASDMVADGEDARVKLAREKRIRRQVLELIQKAREQKVLAEANNEINYLQRRVIALLNKLQETTEENANIKHIMLCQYYALQGVPSLERQVTALKAVEMERDSAIKERRYLMTALAKLKVERDYLEDALTACESENARLAVLHRETHAELEELKARRWWHTFFPRKKVA